VVKKQQSSKIMFTESLTKEQQALKLGALVNQKEWSP
jgi:hypothetical protein